MNVYDLTTNTEYFDPNITLDDFVGTRMWVKVCDKDGFDYYINILGIEHTGTVDTIEYHSVEANVIENYDVDTIYNEGYDDFGYYISDCLYAAHHSHIDIFSLYIPISILTLDEILDALAIVEMQYIPVVDEDDFIDEDDEDYEE